VEEGRAASKQIERGRYLVKTTGCNDCHTPGYIESAGEIEESRWLVGNSLGWQGPWGTTYPANLRLLTQGLTAAQWLQVARTAGQGGADGHCEGSGVADRGCRKHPIRGSGQRSS
jgi:hypothetical protein